MKKKMIPLFLSAASLSACILAGTSMNAQAAANVTINATNFPDESFRSFIRQYDQNENGILETSELAAVETIEADFEYFCDLTGIEHFINLKELDLYGNSLSTLDVSSLNNLTKLDCGQNELTSLKLGKNLTNLKSLSCAYNELSELDVSSSVNLTELDCSLNELSSLNLPNSNQLTKLDCGGNNLTSLNLPNSNQLTKLDCGGNNLTSLDFSKLTQLNYLCYSGNKLGNVDLSKLKNLTYLDCSGTGLTSLDVSSLSSLTELRCSSNNLTSLNVSKLKNLTDLTCYENNITKLDLSNLTNLKTVYCHENNISSLNVNGATNLDQLWCYSNNLSSIDVSALKNLTSFECGDNKLSSLDLRNLTKLEYLWCYSNNLGSLDVSNLKELQYLNCRENKLSHLDVSNTKKLYKLNCSENNISYLDLQNLTELNSLSCFANNLSCLNLSSVRNIYELYCMDNVRTVSVSSANQFDLSTLKGFDVTKCSNWRGGTVSGTILTFQSDTVTYTYDIGFINGYMPPFVDFTLKKESKLATPSAAKLSNTASGINVSWSAVSGAEKYRVYRKTSSTGWGKIADTTSTSYVDTTAKSGTSYIYTIRCINAAGTAFTSDYNKTGSTLVCLAQPTVKAANASTGVKLSWSAVSGADSYILYYKTTGGWTRVVADPVTGTSYTWTGAKSGTSYKFTMKAVKGSTQSSYNTTGTSLTYVAQPTIKAANASTGVKLSWSAISGADSYILYYKTTGGWTRVVADPVTGTSYTWTGAKSGTSYKFTMKAVKGSAQSSYNTTGTALTYVAQPTIKAENASTGVKLSWSAVSGADSYILYYKTTGGWTRVAADPVTGTSYTWTGAKSGTSYKFTMKAVKGSAQSSYNTTGTALVRLTQPTLGTLSRSGKNLTLTWSKVTGASAYRVYRKTGTGGWVRIATVTGTSYTDVYNDTSALSSGTTYTYTVRAENGSSLSSYHTTGKKITY